MSTSVPSLGQLVRAIKIAEEIQGLRADLAAALGRTQAGAKPAAEKKAAPAGKKRKHNFSPEARAKIAAAQKARWARHRKAAAQAPGAKSRK